MARAPLDCPGSLCPVRGLEPGHGIVRELSGQEVRIVAPLTDDAWVSAQY